MSEQASNFQSYRSSDRSRNGGRDGAELADRIPPQNIEAEQSTLGAMLIERTAIEKAAEILDREDFYRESHRVLFDVICALAERDEPVDLITVHEELKNRDKIEAVGGLPYLTSLYESVPTAANVEYYSKIVEEKAILRRLITAAHEIDALARGEVNDVSEVVDEAERAVFSVANNRNNVYFSQLRSLLVDVYSNAERQSELGSQISGLSTGIGHFDSITSGLQNTDLIIIAARPSMGKTSLCLSIAEHVALKEKKPVAIFSLEMSKEQLALRMLCSQGHINAHKLRTGHLSEEEWTRLAHVVEIMYESPIFIDDATETTSLTMRAKCRRLMAEHGLGLVVVDYLQLMGSHKKTENRVQQIGEIARGLKSLARELRVPVIALSQLSRAVESRENKRPMLSDLRESGSIEAEADMVCFLYREAYYKMKEAFAVEGGDRPDTQEMEETEIIVGKHRNGPTGMVKVGFMPEYAKFVDMEFSRDDEPTGF